MTKKKKRSSTLFNFHINNVPALDLFSVFHISVFVLSILLGDAGPLWYSVFIYQDRKSVV